MNSSRVARNLRVRIGRFSGDLSKGLCKAAQRFVGEMVYGIQASRSVMLTEIGRRLEEPVALRKTQWRLSRNLQREELEMAVGDNLLRMASSRVSNDRLLIIDPSDISKSYAREMQFLAKVRIYLKRWTIEDTIRYVKTCYDLENVRVLNYKGLQNLMPLLLAVMYFAACVLDHDSRLRVMAGYVDEAAKLRFGIPDFKLYAQADGLSSILTRHPGRPASAKRCPPNQQMTLYLEFITSEFP